MEKVSWLFGSDSTLPSAHQAESEYYQSVSRTLRQLKLNLRVLPHRAGPSDSICNVPVGLSRVELDITKNLKSTWGVLYDIDFMSYTTLAI